MCLMLNAVLCWLCSDIRELLKSRACSQRGQALVSLAIASASLGVGMRGSVHLQVHG